MRRIPVITVLKTGGDFDRSHVKAFKKQIIRNNPNVDFYCLSDDPGVIDRLPMKYGWPGWWSKMELFTFRGPLIFFDLDTVVLGSVEYLLPKMGDWELVTLRDFNPRVRDIASGVMGWTRNVGYITDIFASDPDGHMERYTTPQKWGDQGFLEDVGKDKTWGRWQDIDPNAFVSWKIHCKYGIPQNAKVLCFHGDPRPWQISWWGRFIDNGSVPMGAKS